MVPYVAEAAEDEEEEEAEVLWDESVYGAPRSEEGEWASCIRLVDCKEGKTLQLIDLEDNEAAFSCCSVQFASRPGEWFVARRTPLSASTQDPIIVVCPSPLL